MANSSFAPEEYLSNLIIYLARSEGLAVETNLGVEAITKKGRSGADRKLEQVRLALARNLARALVVGFENPF